MFVWKFCFYFFNFKYFCNTIFSLSNLHIAKFHINISTQWSRSFKLHHRHSRTFSLSFLQARFLLRPIFFRRRDRIRLDIAFDSSLDLSRINCAEDPISTQYMHTHTHSRHIRTYVWIKSLHSLEKSHATDMPSRIVRAEIVRLLVKSSGETCRESRSRKLDFRKAHSLSLSLFLASLFRLNILVCNSRQDGPQFSGRAHLVVRFSIISATSSHGIVCVCLACVHTCARLYAEIPGLQCDLRRMKVSRMDVRTAPRIRTA